MASFVLMQRSTARADAAAADGAASFSGRPDCLRHSHRRLHLAVRANSNNETASQRNLPVPAAPPGRLSRPPPPPPPPPPPQFKLPPASRRDLLLRAAVIGSLGLGIAKGLSSNNVVPGDESLLAYRASQLGAPGVPPPVRAVVDKQTGEVVGVVAVGASGTQYAVSVDQRQPSTLVLAAAAKGAGGKRQVYALETRYDAVDLANRAQVESIFRTTGWEESLQQLQ